MERINKVALISKTACLAAGEFQRFRCPQLVVFSSQQSALAV
jgi:hypothetical protein